MNAVQEETKKIRNFILFVILPIILFGFGYYKLNGMVKVSYDSVSEKRAKVQYYFRRGFEIPTKENITSRKQRVESARNKLNALKKAAIFDLKKIPEEIQEAGVYFKERLYLTHKELKSSATSQNVKMPEDIGFDETLPSKEKVPYLLNRLELVEILLRILISNRVTSINKIEFSEDMNVRNHQEKVMPAQKSEMHVNLYGSQDSLKKILYEIGNLSPVALVTSVDIKQKSTSELDISLLITQFIEKEMHE